MYSDAPAGALSTVKGFGIYEILYDYASATMSNGRSFAGLSTNTPNWNLTLAFALFFGCYFTMTPVLALAGSMAKKEKHRAINQGSFPLHRLLFIDLNRLLIFLSPTGCRKKLRSRHSIGPNKHKYS